MRLFKYCLKLNLQGPNPEVLVTKNQEMAIKKGKKKKKNLNPEMIKVDFNNCLSSVTYFPCGLGSVACIFTMSFL